MKPVKAIKDPKAFQLLADDTRRKIVFLLRVKEHTVSQIAAELNITPQAVYHHIRKLRDNDLVEVTKEVRVDHLIESYYMATAETFVCSFGGTPSSPEYIHDQTRTILQSLKKIGFEIDFTEDNISQIALLQRKINESCCSGKFEDLTSDLDDVDIFTKQTIQEYAETLTMSEEDFNYQNNLRKELKEALNSLKT